MSNPNQGNQPQPLENDSTNLDNTNTYGSQSTDSAYNDRTQTMDTSRTANPANQRNQTAGNSATAAQPSQDTRFIPDNGTIGVGSPASDAGIQANNTSNLPTTGGPLRSSDISVDPDTLGVSGGSSGNYANSDVILNDRLAGSDAPSPPGEEQGIRGTERPNPPITDLHEQADPSQP